ncbi:MAG TPA: S53 family peptidase [Mycobacterium sp.]|nr:S53 family peptidase [Mycobacterium sp.]
MITILSRAAVTVGVAAALAAMPLVVPAAASASTFDLTALCSPASAGHASCFAEKLNAMTPADTAYGLPSGLGPADLGSAYSLPASPAGAGQTVYIIDAYDDPTAESDLATYRSTYGLAPCTTANGCFAKLNQSGAASPLPSYNSGWAGEISLDLDMVSAVCPACGIRLIEANDNGSGLYVAVHEAVTLGARFVSMSWGGPEWSSETSYDSYFSATGVLFAASTGDNGAAGGPSYPAMSPKVLAVGGTRLSRASNSRGWTETAWTGAGSGCSAYETKPTWQSFIASGTCSRRAGADVSAVADPSTGVAVYHNGWGQYGGTSASAPIVASIYALAGTPAASSSPQSFPYENSTSFNDITSGSTGSCSVSLICTTAAGWDGPTGLGTPNGVAAVTDSGTNSTPPPPTTLGATLTMAGSVIPGEADSATVMPLIPAGRTLASIAWSSSRSDCAFSAPKAASTTITCGASATGSATVAAKVTDSSGAYKTVSGAVTFSTSITKRGVNLAVSFDGQTGSSVSVCTGAASPVVATVTDAVNGVPIKGVSVILTKTASGSTTISSAGSALTGVTGSGTNSQTVSAAATYRVSTTAIGVFNAATPDVITVAVAKCAPTVTGSASANTAWYGGSVTVNGAVTRRDPYGSGTLPVTGLKVPVTVSAAGRTTIVATATTLSDGTFTVTYKATLGGELGLTIPASTPFTAASADLGLLTVQIPSTTITAGSHPAEVGYRDTLNVPGTLTATAAGTYPLSGQTVYVLLTATGSSTAISIGSAKVAGDGTFSAVVSPLASGSLSVRFNGAAGLPAASAPAGSITVDTWTPSLRLSSSSSEVGYGTPVTYTGTVTRSCTADGTVVAAGVPVKIVLTPSSGASPITLGSTTTSSTGAFTFKATPKSSGAVTAVVSNVAGYVNGTSGAAPITVDLWDLTIATSVSASSVVSGTAVTVSGTVSRSCNVASGIPPGLPLKVYDTPAGSGATPVLIGTASVTSTGAYKATTYPRYSGTITVVVSGVAGYNYPATSAPNSITVS